MNGFSLLHNGKSYFENPKQWRAERRKHEVARLMAMGHTRQVAIKKAKLSIR